MTDTAHPLWGRIMDDYDDNYVCDSEAAEREAVFSESVSDSLHVEIGEAISRLCALGKSTVEPDWNDDTSCISLSMLDSVVQYMSFPCSLPRIGEPLVVHGCLKLMKSITRFGRSSPFSYEYGYLCFRILVAAFDFCVLKLSDKYEDWVDKAKRPHNNYLQEGHIPMLSKEISEVVAEYMTHDGGICQCLYKDFPVPLPWTDSYNGPLITTHQIHLLQHILDEDRKHFLIFLRSNYSLGLSALFFTVYKYTNSTTVSLKKKALDRAFRQLYYRSLLVAPDPPLGGGKYGHLANVLGRHGLTPLDVEDSNLVLHAYIDRLTILSGTGLHPRASPALALELLQYAQRLICQGCEDLVPYVIRVTIRCMWEDLVDGEPATISFIDDCAQLLKCVANLLRFLLDYIEVARHALSEAMNAIIEEELISLVIRILLAIHSTNAKIKGPTASLIHAAVNVFLVFQKVTPLAYLERQFCQYTHSWIAFLENAHRAVVPKSHRVSWMRSTSFLSRTVAILGGDRNSFDRRCRNPRCPGPMTAVYTASDLVYCSADCYARSWMPNSHEDLP